MSDSTILYFEKNKVELESKKKNRNLTQLGSITSFVPAGGNFQETEEDIKEEEHAKNRRQLFLMRKLAGKIIGQKWSKKLQRMVQNRVDVCSCTLMPSFNKVSIFKTKENDKMFYSGLMRCGNLWTCPQCAFKISEYRSHVVRVIFENAKKQEYQMRHLVLTVSHHKGQRAKDLQKLVSTAWRKVTGCRAFIKKQEELGLTKEEGFGFIRALEVTVGNNGFHPHLHIMILGLQNQETLAKLCDFAISLWQKKVVKLGFEAPLIDVQKHVPVYDEQAVGRYITKWNMSKELTQGHIKSSKDENGKKHGRAPFDLLRDMVNLNYDEQTRNTDYQRDWDLFKEWADASVNVKQLTFSDGLKEMLFKEKEKTDQEVVNEGIENKILIAEIDKPLWKIIILHNLEADVLSTAEKGGINSICAVLRLKNFKIKVIENLIKL